MHLFSKISIHNSKILSAFTLVELLVVVAIIGITSTIIATSTNGSQKSARDAIRKSNLAVIRNALVQYGMDKGALPGNDTPGSSYDSKTGENWIPELVPDYLKTIPQDPRQAGLMNYYANVIKNKFHTKKSIDVYAVPVQTNPGPGVFATIFSSTPTVTNEYWYYSLGISFVPTHDLDVTGIGAFINGTKKITLWDGAGNVLAESNVTASNNWAMNPLAAPVRLTGGVTYYLGGYFGEGTTRVLWSGTAPSTPDIGSIVSISHSGEVNMGLEHNVLGHGTWYMGTPDFSITTVATPSPTPTPTPEPTPTPTSTPTPSNQPSPEITPEPAPDDDKSKQYYAYYPSDDKKSFVLWARLERSDDPEINHKPNAACQESTPNGTFFNYCVKGNI